MAKEVPAVAPRRRLILHGPRPRPDTPPSTRPSTRAATTARMNLPASRTQQSTTTDLTPFAFGQTHTHNFETSHISTTSDKFARLQERALKAFEGIDLDTTHLEEINEDDLALIMEGFHGMKVSFPNIVTAGVSRIARSSGRLGWYYNSPKMQAVRRALLLKREKIKKRIEIEGKAREARIVDDDPDR